MHINELIKEEPVYYPVSGESDRELCRPMLIANECVPVKPITEMTPEELRCISIYKPYYYFDGSYEAAVQAITHAPKMFVHVLDVNTEGGRQLSTEEKRKCAHRLLSLTLSKSPALVGSLIEHWHPGPSDESRAEWEYKLIEVAARHDCWVLRHISSHLTENVQKRLFESKYYNAQWLKAIMDPTDSIQRAYVDDKTRFSECHTKIQFLSEYNINRAKELYKDNPAIMHSLEARVNGRLPEGYKPLLETAMEQTERIMINGGK